LRFGRRLLAGTVVAAGAGAAWSLFEAQWVERDEIDVELARLPAALDGFRLLHLSDLHLGTLSLNWRAVDVALAWAQEHDPELIVITGDLVSRRGGKAKLEQALDRLRARHGVYAILGNHDVDEARDPFARPTDLSDLGAAGATLLRDEGRSFDVRGVRVQVVGVDPRTYRAGESMPAARVDAHARFRILLSHYPEIVRYVPTGIFDLVLAGHLHGGQICLPSPWGKIHLKDMRSQYWEGLFETRAGVLHVSRGLGTSLVPFRFLARPQATLLTLRPRR
jgi:uncharacterized protein